MNCSSPNSSLVCFLALPLQCAVMTLVQPPRAPDRDPFALGRGKPASSAVRIERTRTDVCTTSGRSPCERSIRPAASASASPRSDRPTSTHPVKSPCSFHSLSPWRKQHHASPQCQKAARREQAAALPGSARACTAWSAPADGRPLGGSLDHQPAHSSARPAGHRRRGRASTSTRSRWRSSRPAAASRWRSSPARFCRGHARHGGSWCRGRWSATWWPACSRSSTRTTCPARSAATPGCGCCAPRGRSRRPVYEHAARRAAAGCPGQVAAVAPVEQ